MLSFLELLSWSDIASFLYNINDYLRIESGSYKVDVGYAALSINQI